MRSREERRQARRIATRMKVPRLLLAGDADEVLAGLRRDAGELGIELVPDGAVPDGAVPDGAVPDSATPGGASPRDQAGPTDAADASGASDAAGALKPTVVVVAVWILPKQSALTRGLRALEQQEPRLGPETVRIVVTLSGASRRAPAKLLKALTPELLYQVESGIEVSESRRPWRTARLRSVRTLLGALGVRVFRVAPPPAS